MGMIPIFDDPHRMGEQRGLLRSRRSWHDMAEAVVNRTHDRLLRLQEIVDRQRRDARVLAIRSDPAPPPYAYGTIALTAGAPHEISLA